jgi:hypothetical protein
MAKDLKAKVQKAAIKAANADFMSSVGATFTPQTIAVIPKQYVILGEPVTINGETVTPLVVTMNIYNKADYEAGNTKATPMATRTISYRNLDMRTHGTTPHDVFVTDDPLTGKRTLSERAEFTNRIGGDPVWGSETINGNSDEKIIFLKENYVVMCGDKSTHLIPALEKHNEKWRVKADENKKVVWASRGLCLLEKMNEKGNPVLQEWIKNTIENEIYENARVK